MVNNTLDQAGKNARRVGRAQRDVQIQVQRLTIQGGMEGSIPDRDGEIQKIDRCGSRGGFPLKTVKVVESLLEVIPCGDIGVRVCGCPDTKKIINVLLEKK